MESDLPETKGNGVQIAPQGHDFQEAFVKTMKSLWLAVLGFSLLAAPALAQKGGRSNKGGATTGIARSDKVQAMNKKGDKDHDPSPSKGSKSKGQKIRTREGWEKNAKHKGSSK